MRAFTLIASHMCYTIFILPIFLLLFSSFIIGILYLFLCRWWWAVCADYKMVCSPFFFFICSHRTGVALRRHRRHHQWDPDRVHHSRASSWGIASGPQDSRTGFWRWRTLSGNSLFVFCFVFLLVHSLPPTPTASLSLPVNNEITPVVTL